MELLPPKNPNEFHITSIRLNTAMWADLTRIAKATGHTRAEVVVSFLAYAIHTWKQRQAHAGQQPEQNDAPAALHKTPG